MRWMTASCPCSGRVSCFRRFRMLPLSSHSAVRMLVPPRSMATTRWVELLLPVERSAIGACELDISLILPQSALTGNWAVALFPCLLRLGRTRKRSEESQRHSSANVRRRDASLAIRIVAQMAKSKTASKYLSVSPRVFPCPKNRQRERYGSTYVPWSEKLPVPPTFPATKVAIIGRCTASLKYCIRKIEKPFKYRAEFAARHDYKSRKHQRT